MCKKFFLSIGLCLFLIVWASQLHAQSIVPAGTASFCPGKNVQLSVKDATQVTAYQWLKNGMVIPGQNSNGYFANADGDYSVIVTVGGKADTLTAVKVSEAALPAQPTFSSSPSGQCATTPIQFTTTSATTGLTFLWDYGDGGSATTANTSHSFLSAVGDGLKNIPVKLTVTNASGCSSSVISNISVNQLPDINVGSNEEITTFPVTNGTTTFRVCSNPATYEFTFLNQSQTSTNNNYVIKWGDATSNFTSADWSSTITHVYPRGISDMSVTITNKAGCSSSKNYKVFVGSNPFGSIGSGNTTNLCSPSTATFNINGTDVNALGTLYTFSTSDDPSSTQTFTHPPPATVPHTFMKSSCGFNTPTDPNAFFVLLKIENPCEISNPSYSPIRIAGKPNAVIQTKANVCINAVTLITNTKEYGDVPSSSGCNDKGKQVWKITPAIGYSYTGLLGDLKGIYNPPYSGWVNGSDDLNVTFNTPGIYTVKLYMSNSGSACGIDSTEQTICVRNPPTASFTLDKKSGCSPLVVSTNNTSPAGPCGGETYTWKVKYIDPLNCGTGDGFQFQAGSTADTKSPKLTFNKPGRYAIELNVTATAGCGPVKAYDTIDVTSPPTVNINPIGSACAGVAFSPTATVNTCYSTGPITYLWTFPNGTPASSNNLNPGVVSISSGTSSNITLTVTNQCGDGSDNETVTITTKPVIQSVASKTICSGKSAAIPLVSVPVVNTFSWTSTTVPAGNFGNTSKNNQSVAVINDVLTNTGTADVVVTYKIVVAGGCPSDTLTAQVIVSPNGSTANAGPDQYLCNLNAATLDGNTAVVGVGDWTQVSGPTSAIITDPSNPNTTVINLLPNGNYTFAWTIKSGNSTCAISSDEVTIFVRPSLTKPNAGTDGSLCISTGTTYQLQANAVQLPEVGKWTFVKPPSAGNASIQNVNNASTLVTGLDVGAKYFVWTISNDAGCTPVSDTVVISVGAGAESADAGPDQTLCNVTQVTLAGNTPSVGTGEWKQTAGTAATITSPTSPNSTVTGLQVGTYQFEWSLSAGGASTCGNATDVVTIVVRPPLTIPNAGTDINLCTTNGNEVTLQANAVQAPEVGKWTVASNTIGTAFITNVNNAGTKVTGLNVGTKYLIWTITNDANCPALADTVMINVGAGADAADAGDDQELCNVAQANLAGNTPSAGSGKWRQISGPSNSNIISDISPNTVVSGLVNGTYEFEWSLAAGGTSSCGNSIDTVRIIIYPAIQASVSPLTQTICNGGTITINSNTPTGGNGTYKYQWQSSNNNTNFNDILGEGNASLTASPVVDTWYRLVVTSGPCSTPTVSASVTVQAGISNNTIAANQVICIGNTAALIVGSTPSGGDGIFSYQWQSSSDSINWNNLNAILKDYQPVEIGATLAYRRIVKTALCDAASNVLTVTVNPDAKALFQPSKTVGCAPFNITPTVINQTTFDDRNGSFNWFANNTVIGSGVFPGYSISNAGDSVLIKLIAVSKFGCKNDSVQAWFFSPINPKPAFTLSDTVGCGPLSVVLNNATPDTNNFNFIWDFGNGQTSSDQQPGTINFLANPNFGDTVYTVRLKATGGCDTIAVVQSIRVKSLPKALFTPDIVEGCSPMKVTFTNISRGSNATFVWDFGDGSAQVPATNPTIQHIFNTGVKDTFYVKLIGSNDCGKDTQQYAIVVNPNRIRLDFAVNGNQKNVCIPDTILFVNNTTGANQFVWDFGDGSPKLTTTKGIDSVYHEYTQRGVYTVTLFGTNGCSDTTSTETITVENRPKVSFTATPSEVCLGGAIQMANTSDTSLAWAWDFGDGSTSSQLNPSKTYINTGSYQIVLTGTKVYPQGFGCPATDTAVVTINGPDGELRYNGGYTCIGNTVRFETISSNTSQYRYYFGNGDSLISSTPIVSYNYPLPGTYLPYVQLVSGSCSKIIKGIDSVKIDRVRVAFITDSSTYCGSTVMRFSNQSDAYFGTKSLAWDFGDGTTSTLANPTKTYTSAGAYNVRLSITGQSGCIAVLDSVIDVAVRQTPVAAISGNLEACAGKYAGFKSETLSVDSILGHSWSFGNNNIGTGANAGTAYANAGAYTVRLISRTITGCADTAFQTVTVRPSPTVTVSPDTRICMGQSATLFASGTASIQWTPDNGLSCVACSNPIAKPDITTRYFATATNAFGCTSTDSVTVEVIRPLEISVMASDTMLCVGESTQLFASGANRYEWNPSVGLSASNTPNPIATPTSTATYRVVGFDSYNCFTDTAYTTIGVGGYPVVELGIGDTVVAGTAITITPILTNGPFKSFTWTPSKGLNPPDGQNPVATIDNAITYTLVAENIYGCTGTDTISYQVFCSKDDQVYIPNAFSPDGDGVNDVFMVYGKGIKVDYFKVYNRWGQVVFDGGSNYLPNLPQFGWNGRVGGKPATQDVYVYMVQLKCTAGGTFTYKGNVSLLLMR